jgi:hypothetical protein
MYHHLPRFMRTFGRETILGLPLTLLNVVAILVGLSVGRSVGPALHLPGLLFLGQTILWMVLGVIVTYEYHGLFVMHRLFLAAQYQRRVILRRRTVNASGWAVRVEQDDDTPLLPEAVLEQIVGETS